MADNLTVSASYVFKSNAAEVLGKAAQCAKDMAVAIDAATDSAKILTTELRALSQVASGVTLTLGNLATSMRSISANLDRVATVVDRTAVRVESGFDAMEVAADDAAINIDTATSTMIARISAVAGAANVTTAALRTMSNSANGVRSPGSSGGSSRGSSHGGIGGTIASGIGFTALGTVAVGIHQAAETQQALLRLSAQTGRSYKNLSAEYMPIIRNAGDRIGMSQKDAIGITSEVAGVIKDPRELREALIGQGKRGGILDLVGVMMKAGVSTGSPEHTAKNIIQLDHILNAYKGPEMSKVNDMIYRATVSSKMDLGTVVTQIAYFGEQYRLAMGQNNKSAPGEILNLASLGYWGIGHGKWGAGFGQVLKNIMRPTNAEIPYQIALGVLNKDGSYGKNTVNAKGQFTPAAAFGNALTILAKSGLTPMAQQRMIALAFSTNAARNMAEATSPKTAAFLKRLQDSQNKLPDVMGAEANLMKGLNEQTGRLETNFKALAAIISGPLIQPLTNFVSNLSGGLKRGGDFLAGHPAANKAATAAVVGAGVYGAIKLAQMVGGFHGAVHALAHNALHNAGVSGVILQRRGIFSRAGGAMSKAGGGLRGALSDALSMKATRGAIGEGIGNILPHLPTGFLNIFSSFGRVLTSIGAKFFNTRMAIASIGDVVGHLGMKSIPVVGEVLMLIDTLRFLGQHSKNIGEILGHVIAWLIRTGGPMFISVMKSVIMGIFNEIVGAFQFVFGGLFDTIRGHGLFDFIKDIAKNTQSTIASDNADPNSHREAMKASKTASVVNNNTYVMHGEAARAEVKKSLLGTRGSNASAGSSATTHIIPAAQTSGIQSR